MKLELMIITTKMFLHAGRGCKPAKQGWGIKDGAMKNDFSGSSLCGSTSGGYRDGAFSDGTTATVLEQCFHSQKSVDVLRDEERELVDHPLSWE